MTYIKGAWMQTWMYGQPTAAETRLADVIALCLDYGLGGIAVKALDGLTWMGDVDGQRQYPDALRDFGQIGEQREQCAAAGLGYAVWTNPLHGGADFLDRQADTYAEAGEAAGMLILDTEPYAGFWGANRPVGAAHRFMDRLRHAATDLPLVWQPDPRPARLAELRPDEWAPYMNVYAPQCYWTDFGTRPEVEIARSAEQCGSLGIAEYAPTLPGNATVGDLRFSINAAENDRCAGVVVWRLGSTGPAQLAVLRDTPLYVLPPAPPVDPCADLKAELERLRAGAREIAARLLELANA